MNRSMGDPRECVGEMAATGESPTPPFVDIHCHCLPALDDGPDTVEEAVELCRSLVADGIEVVVATPHQFGIYEGDYEPIDIRQAVASLNESLREARVPLEVRAGADVRVDERIPRMLKDDRVLTIADGGRYILLELPHDTFMELGPLLAALASMSVTAVISHPERNRYLNRHREAVQAWAEYDACLQITASSFLGDFGSRAEQAAWSLIELGMPVLVATDAHGSIHRPPRMTAASEEIIRRMGRPTADLLCRENPRRVLQGCPMKSVQLYAEKEVRR